MVNDDPGMAVKNLRADDQGSTSFNKKRPS
jgi:hypothetical protein